MKRQVRSFICAFRGLGQSFREPHMRFHLVACCYVLYFSLFYDFSKAEYSALFVVMTLVFAAECVNTSIERLSDRVTQQWDEKIRMAKDLAAGAVLITALGALAVGFALFWDLTVFGEIAGYFGTNLTRWIPFLASLAVSGLFIAGKLFRREESKDE